MKKIILSAVILIFLIVIISCTSQTQVKDEIIPHDRLSKIPADADKMKPEDDLFPPVLHSDQWQEPVPMSDTITL